MTIIIVTRQLRVTLDSIRNSCDVSFRNTTTEKDETMFIFGLDSNIFSLFIDNGFLLPGNLALQATSGYYSTK